MPRLHRTVIVLGLVSFFTDFSSEMIFPLLPVFLSQVLGAGALALGVIEGVAESTAAFLKIASGVWTDRAGRRKPLVVAGYGLAGLVRPLIGLATAWPFVLAMRFLDRVGKGLRTSPRDALIADVTDPRWRGEAFGFHRAMDHAGAVVGPLAAAALLHWWGLPLRQIFWLAAIPAVVVMIILIAGVRESPAPPAAGPRPRLGLAGHWHAMGGPFRWLLLAVLVFTLGNSTDLFLMARLGEAGVAPAWLAALWAAHHVVKMAATYLGGRLSDRVGRRRMIQAGWFFYALVYLGFARFDTPAPLVALFLAYGIYYGLTEPAERAWIADLAPGGLRGTAFGYYHGVVGLGALPASVLFGLIWKSWGAGAAFGAGAALAVAASALLALVRSISSPSTPN